LFESKRQVGDSQIIVGKRVDAVAVRGVVPSDREAQAVDCNIVRSYLKALDAPGVRDVCAQMICDSRVIQLGAVDDVEHEVRGYAGEDDNRCSGGVVPESRRVALIVYTPAFSPFTRYVPLDKVVLLAYQPGVALSH